MSSSANEPGSGSCLVARAIPCAVNPVPIRDLDAIISKAEPVKEGKSKIAEASADALAESLRKLSMNSNSLTMTSGTKKSPKAADPADFVTLQSLRSSALARKTNTTSKFGRDGAALFADLLHNEKEEKSNAAAEAKAADKKPEEEKKKEESVAKESAEKENQKTKDEKPKAVDEQQPKKDGEESEKAEASEDYLLSRGPVRAARTNATFHPYGAKGFPGSNESYDQMCPTLGHPGSIHGQYSNEYNHWNVGADVFSNSSTPDTVTSDLGYSSSSTSPHLNYCVSNPCSATTELPTSSSSKDDAELPDALSDFILAYSRNYRGPRTKIDPTSDEPFGSDMSPKSGRPASVESNLCDSPLSAGSAPQSSPAAPRGGITGPSTPISDYRGCNRMGPLRTQLPSGQYTAHLGRQCGGQQLEQHVRPAKEVLRSLIRAEEMDDAWAWTSKCMQNYPGALCYQDKDKDTLLHIVTDHLDLGKIYALVEQMLKTEYAGHQKPFDMKNRLNATPLFLAVEKRHNEIVDYLLEAGADPNTQNSKSERDAPLHYAASHGLTDIVKTICSYSTTNLNLSNGMGLTPLLCAVKNHGVYEDEGGYVIDNSETIQMLLKFGADPMITDATNGRTAMHYAVDRMSPEVIDVFKNNLDEDTMTALVNQPDNSKETALENVHALSNLDENTRFKLCLSLMICGANNSSGSPQ